MLGSFSHFCFPHAHGMGIFLLIGAVLQVCLREQNIDFVTNGQKEGERHGDRAVSA